MYERILEYASSFDSNLGLVINDMITGKKLEVNPNRQFRAASIIKLTIMWEYFNQLYAGQISPDEIMILRDSVKVGSSPYDTGILREMHDGLSITANDALSLMVIISDDTATNMLLDRLGIENINKTIQSLGLRDTSVQRKMFEYDKAIQGIDNYTTANDMNSIIQCIYSGSRLTLDIHKEMKVLLGKQQVNCAIPLFLPKDIIIAHKTGSILDFHVEHDVGVIYDKSGRPIVSVSVLTENIQQNRTVIATIAKMAYDETKCLIA